MNLNHIYTCLIIKQKYTAQNGKDNIKYRTKPRLPLRPYARVRLTTGYWLLATVLFNGWPRRQVTRPKFQRSTTHDIRRRPRCWWQSPHLSNSLTDESWRLPTSDDEQVHEPANQPAPTEVMTSVARHRWSRECTAESDTSYATRQRQLPETQQTTQRKTMQ